MKLTDAENAADGIFFPALEQNMMGAVLINENDEVMFSTQPQRSSGDISAKRSLAITSICSSPIICALHILNISGITVKVVKRVSKE